MNFSTSTSTPISAPWLQARKSGVLAHISSLPGKFGIGNIGESSRQFLRFASECGFHCWQICPIGPTGYGDSPYQSFSSFAGNRYFIDYAELVKIGLLADSDTEPLQNLSTKEVDYGALYHLTSPILTKAKQRFDELKQPILPGFISFAEFQKKNRYWLDSYSLFMSLKDFHNGHPWYLWPREWRDYESARKMSLCRDLVEKRERYAFTQYLFYWQLDQLHSEAKAMGIEIIGDMPIYVAYDSADCWANSALFDLSPDGKLLTVSGVPPDYYSSKGQKWGNPLYNWEYHEASQFHWWINRLKHNFSIYDIVRLDHYRAFDTYWCIPAESKDAVVGEWRVAPGEKLFQKLHEEMPGAQIIAEDLGYITESVYQLRLKTGFPGMKILQFGFGHDPNNINLPHHYERNSVVYTGTHDNDTCASWLSKLSRKEMKMVKEYYPSSDGISGTWAMIRAALGSVANLAVLPVQDLFELGNEARLNFPGVVQGNWIWRFEEDLYDTFRKEKMQRINTWQSLFGRTGEIVEANYSADPQQVELVTTLS